MLAEGSIATGVHEGTRLWKAVEKECQEVRWGWGAGWGEEELFQPGAMGLKETHAEDRHCPAMSSIWWKHKYIRRVKEGNLPIKESLNGLHILFRNMEKQSDSGRNEKDYLWREALWGTLGRVSWETYQAFVLPNFWNHMNILFQ